MLLGMRTPTGGSYTPPASTWILATGSWDDAGVWDDSANWNG